MLVVLKPAFPTDNWVVGVTIGAFGTARQIEGRRRREVDDARAAKRSIEADDIGVSIRWYDGRGVERSGWMD